MNFILGSFWADLRRQLAADAGMRSALAGCGQRIGEDVSEKLDYEPGIFAVERHVRGKWACRCCQKLMQASVPAQVIDKGIPTAGMLAHLLVAKFLNHLPLYRQEYIFECAGRLIARSTTLAEWVGECGAGLQPLVQALADEPETPNSANVGDQPPRTTFRSSSQFERFLPAVAVSSGLPAHRVTASDGAPNLLIDSVHFAADGLRRAYLPPRREDRTDASCNGFFTSLARSAVSSISGRLRDLARH